MSDDNLQIQSGFAMATLNLNASVGLVVRQPATTTVTDSFKVRLASAATQIPMGILYSATNAAGGDVGVAMDGSLVWAIAGAAFVSTTQKWVMSSPSGRVIPFTGLSTNYVVGRVLPQADAASGDKIRILVNTDRISSN